MPISSEYMSTKIENIGPKPVITRINTKPVEAPVKLAAEKTEHVQKISGTGRITRWFSQAGIYAHSNHRPKESIEHKISERFKLKERRKISNLENILSKAIDFCLDDGPTDDIDPDWFFSFVKMAEEIHSPPMQELWGKIFAVENSKPGSFSLNTLQLLKQITQKDALLFRRAVNFTSRQKGDPNPKLLIGYNRKKSLWSFLSTNNNHKLNLALYGLSYPDLLALMDLGLIHHSEIESGELESAYQLEWRISGQTITLSPKSRGITLVYFKFTTTGAELSKLVNSQKQDHYIAAIKQTLSAVFDMTE